jgi:hypothetical protein
VCLSNLKCPFLNALNSNLLTRTSKYIDRTFVYESFLYTIGTNLAQIVFENREKHECQFKKKSWLGE